MCKGSTADSDSVCLGSNPGTAAKSLGLREPRLFYEVWLSLVERYVRDVEVAGSNPVIPICFIIFVLRYNYPYLYRDVAGSPVKKLTKCQVFTGQANGEPKVRWSRLENCKRSLQAHLLEDETGRQEQNPVIPISCAV